MIKCVFVGLVLGHLARTAPLKRLGTANRTGCVFGYDGAAIRRRIKALGAWSGRTVSVCDLSNHGRSRDEKQYDAEAVSCGFHGAISFSLEQQQMSYGLVDAEAQNEPSRFRSASAACEKRGPGMPCMPIPPVWTVEVKQM